MSTSTTNPTPTKETDTFFPAQSDLIPTTTSTENYASESSVAALKAIIQDLTLQRHKLDITIQVLNDCLQDILAQKPAARSK